MAIDLNEQTEAYLGWEARWGIEQFLFAAQGNDIDFSTKSDKVQADGFGQRVKNALPGMQEGTVKVKGMAAMERGALIWQLRQWQGRKSPVNAWLALQGQLALLQPITYLPASVTDTSVTAKLKDPVDFTLELAARGAYDDGVILLSPQNLLVGASGTGPQDINTLYGGATTNGGSGVLHVWAFDGGTAPTVTVTIQHSPDGVTWTNLVAFQAQSVLGSQRIPLPSTTTINAYVQAIWTTTGSPTDVQVLCAVSRAPNLNV
jgi:hypothetical protein